MPFSFTRVLAVTALVAVALLPTLAQAKNTVVRIGYQRSSTLMTLLRENHSLSKRLAAQGVTVEWHEFSSGLPMLEALNTGNLDLSADVADTVPIFAQAAGANLVFYATEAPSPSGQALIVHAGSDIHSVADLKDKRVTVTRGAGDHYLLLAALKRAGLGLDDIKLSYLAPQDASAAFSRHSVDAWVAWEPYLSAARAQGHTRTITDGRNGLASYRRFYLASADFARAHSDALATVYHALAKTGSWVRAHPAAAAQRLSPLWGDMNVDVVRHALADRSYDIEPVAPDQFGEQQKIADAFEQAGVLPKHVDTRDALIWRPGQAKLAGARHE